MNNFFWCIGLPWLSFAFGILLLWVLNSRQWLIAMVIVPLMAAGAAWLWADGTAAIIVYWLTLIAFFAPFGYWLRGGAKMDNADLNTLWQQPVKLWRRENQES